MVIRADKGVAMVVMDMEDYAENAQSLLADTTIYKTITKEPTNKLKINFPTLRDIKTKKGLVTTITEKFTPPVWFPKFHDLPKIHKVGTPLGPLFPVEGPSHMGWPRGWPTLFAFWKASPHTISETPNTS